MTIKASLLSLAEAVGKTLCVVGVFYVMVWLYNTDDIPRGTVVQILGKDVIGTVIRNPASGIITVRFDAGAGHMPRFTQADFQISEVARVGGPEP